MKRAVRCSLLAFQMTCTFPKDASARLSAPETCRIQGKLPSGQGYTTGLLPDESAIINRGLHSFCFPPVLVGTTKSTLNNHANPYIYLRPHAVPNTITPSRVPVRLLGRPAAPCADEDRGPSGEFSEAAEHGSSGAGSWPVFIPWFGDIRLGWKRGFSVMIGTIFPPTCPQKSLYQPQHRR